MTTPTQAKRAIPEKCRVVDRLKLEFDERLDVLKSRSVSPHIEEELRFWRGIEEQLEAVKAALATPSPSSRPEIQRSRQKWAEDYEPVINEALDVLYNKILRPLRDHLSAKGFVPDPEIVQRKAILDLKKPTAASDDCLFKIYIHIKARHTQTGIPRTDQSVYKAMMPIVRDPGQSGVPIYEASSDEALRKKMNRVKSGREKAGVDIAQEISKQAVRGPCNDWYKSTIP